MQLMSIFESSNLPLTISSFPFNDDFPPILGVRNLKKWILPHTCCQYDLCTWGLAKIESILDVDS